MRHSLNLPNQITLARLGLAIVFIALLSRYSHQDPEVWRLDVACVLFIIAAATDFLDGYIARKYGLMTPLGRVMDPLVDKVLICGAFILFTGDGFVDANGRNVTGVQAWMAVVIVGRELLVTGLRGFNESMGKDFGASIHGKLKMWMQSIAAPVILFLVAHENVRLLGVPSAWMKAIMVWLTIAITAFSMIHYLIRSRYILEASAAEVTELDVIRAVLLGVIQGITEFLPISSSAHLALSQRRMGLDPDSPPLLLFDALSHVGTVISMAIVFAPQAARWLNQLKAEAIAWRGDGPPVERATATRVLLLAIAATVPTGVIGLTFKDKFEAAFDDPFGIGVCLIVTGCLLGALVKFRRGRRGWWDFPVWQAILIGVAQGCAILPGISRSGATISAATFCGLRRRWAAEFSFLIAVPAILGGAVIKLKDTAALPSEELGRIPWGPLCVGTVISTILGVVALRWLLHIVRRAKLHYFAVYCWLVGLAVVLAYR